MPATPASERPFIPSTQHTQQQEQSKEVFCPLPGEKARRPANSSDFRFLGGNSLWGRRLLELFFFQNQRQGWLEETQTHPTFYYGDGENSTHWLQSQGAFQEWFLLVL